MPELTHPNVRVRVCGEVAVASSQGSWHAARGRQAQLVLAHLALEDRAVRREALADLLWGEAPSAHWAGALRGVLSKVRTTLVEAGYRSDALRSEDTTIRLELPGDATTDVAAADAAVTVAEDSLATAALDTALDAARWAEDALDGVFLPHQDDEWSSLQRLRIERLHQRAVHVHVRALAGLGRPADAADRARVHVAAQPLDESMHHELVTSLIADGQRAEALRAFGELQHVLQTELGIAPAERTASLVAGLAAAPVLRERGRSGVPGPSFVGRADETTLIGAASARVFEGGRPEMVVLTGPAGIGKTRLARHICDSLDREGVVSVWGHNRATDGRAFGAVADAVSAAINADPRLLDRVADRAAGLVRLLPELRTRFPRYQLPADHGEARTHLFAAVRAIFGEFARGPAVLVLDDLQWAPDSTLALLEDLLDELPGQLLVLATAREEPGEWESSLLTIQRLVPVETVCLEPLTVDELAELVAGHPPPFDRATISLSQALHERTAGLPFFAAEIVQASQRSNAPIDPADTPAAARDWIRRRIDALPPDRREILTAAAVIGNEVDLALLRGCCPDVDLEDALEDLLTLGILVESEWQDSVLFAHAITRDVTYDEIRLRLRRNLHHQIAAGIASLPPAPGRNDLVAQHARLAGPAGRRAATAFANEAGREDLAVGDWDRAAEQFRHSLASAESPIAIARATIGLGQARLRQRCFEEARALLEQAAATAHANDLPFELAEATLALVGRRGRGASPDRSEQIARLRLAADALERSRPGLQPADRHRWEVLLSGIERELAISLLLTGEVEERAILLDRALARARSSDPPEPATLAAALQAKRILPEAASRPAARLADVSEVLAMPAAQLPPDLRIATHCYRHEDLVQLGEHDRARAALEAADLLIDRYADPYWRWVVATWRGLGRIVSGDLEAAEAFAAEGRDLLPGVSEAGACFGVNLVNIRLYQRRAGDVLDLLAAAAESAPHIPCYRAVLALAATEAEDPVLAEQAYRWFADRSFASLPLDTNRFLALAVLAHVAAELGDARGGAVLERELQPFDGLQVTLNCFGGGGAWWGPTTHALARLALLRGGRDDARLRFDRARAEATGAPLAQARIDRDASDLEG